MPEPRYSVQPETGIFKFGIYDRRSRKVVRKFGGPDAQEMAEGECARLNGGDDRQQDRKPPIGHDRRKGERGNIFFALFGAVALLGVVGSGANMLMRGPIASMVAVQKAAKTDTQMNMAAAVVMQAAAAQAVADCDGDGLSEPLAADMGFTAMTGAGRIPAGLGAPEIDPYGTPYAYCAWDHLTVDPAACPGRLAGATPAGPVLIAIVSAGPDKVFQSECGAAPDYLIHAAGDDRAAMFSPAEAGQLAGGGGLWVLDPDDDTATIDKDLKVTTDLAFSGASSVSFDQSARLDLAGLFMLPDQNSMTACNAANKGGLRRLAALDAEAVEICDGAEWQAVGIRNFDKLLDVAGYAGNAGKVVRYNSAEDGLDAVSFDWLSLTDTPDDYAGQGGKLLAVNDAASGQHFAENMTYNPDGNLILGGSGAVKVPAGATAEQPAGAAGMIRFNTTKGKFEGYDGGAWKALGGDSASGTMLDGWPDAIKCSGGGGTAFLDLVFSGTAGATYAVRGWSGGSQRQITYGANGAYLTTTEATGGFLTDCANKSIAQHYAAGTAYNFTGPVVNVSGASTFTALTDAPSAYTGQAGKVVGVKADETGLEFKANGGTLSCTTRSASSAPTPTTISVSCLSDEVATSGLCTSSPSNSYAYNYESGNGWACSVNTSKVVRVRCCKIQ